jgi:hypothetical protein
MDNRYNSFSFLPESATANELNRARKVMAASMAQTRKRKEKGKGKKKKK